MAKGGQNKAAGLALEGEGLLPVMGELGSGGGSLVTRETREGHSPHCPFGKNNLQLGQGPSLWEGRSRAQGPGEAEHGSGWGWTESRRPAILSALTMEEARSERAQLPVASGVFSWVMSPGYFCKTNF